MFTAVRLSQGLLAAHIFLAMSYIIGAAILPVFQEPPQRLNAREALVRATTLCAVGSATLGFALFALACVGWLNPLAIGATAAALGVIPGFLVRESPLRREYWKRRAALVVQAFDGGALLVYYGMLVLSVPAIMPNVGGDPIHYHLAYAQDWANSGRLVVDPLLRFPFYASNFLLVYCVALVFKIPAALNFISWEAGLLTALVIYAVARDALDTASTPQIWNTVSAWCLAFAVAGSPVYWRWMTTAYMDIPIASLALFAIIALALAVTTRQIAWIVASSIVAAFLIGCKPSFILLAPMFIVAIVVTGKQLDLPIRRIAAILLLFAVCASPWYVRNVALTGDPIPPVLNLAIHHRDGFIDKSEWAAIQEDLSTLKTASGFISAPVRAFKDPLSMNFREYGSNALILLLFVPPLWVLLVFGTRGTVDFRFTLFTGCLVVLIGYWFAVSSLLRYALLFFPILAVSIAFCAASLLRWRPRLAPIVATVATLTLIPTPGATSWYTERYRNDYAYASDVFKSDDAYLRVNDDGYAEEQFAVARLHQMGAVGTVYIIGGATEYFFRRDGFETAGDWVGPAGWFRLYRAIDTNQVAEYLDSLGIAAVLVDPKFVLGALDGPLQQQLLAHGFMQFAIPASDYELYVRQNVAARATVIR